MLQKPTDELILFQDNAFLFSTAFIVLVAECDLSVFKSLNPLV